MLNTKPSAKKIFAVTVSEYSRTVSNTLRISMDLLVHCTTVQLYGVLVNVESKANEVLVHVL